MRLVATERPRAVLLDIGLPDINGIEVLKRIKRSAPEVMVIMLSSNAAEVHRIEAEVHGANGYVDKERMYTDLIPLLVALL